MAAAIAKALNLSEAKVQAALTAVMPEGGGGPGGANGGTPPSGTAPASTATPGSTT
jgi:hypothetical protein